MVTKSALVEDYYSSPPSIFIYIGIFQQRSIRSIRELSFLENLHMGNQGVSESQEPSNTQEVAAPPHPGMVVQQTGDCSSAVSYCAQLAHCASRVPACARSHRWWYSHPKHTGPCLLQREAHFRRVRASIDASRTQSSCLLLRSVLAEAS